MSRRWRENNEKRNALRAFRDSNMKSRCDRRANWSSSSRVASNCHGNAICCLDTNSLKLAGGIHEPNTYMNLHLALVWMCALCVIYVTFRVGLGYLRLISRNAYSEWLKLWVGVEKLFVQELMIRYYRDYDMCFDILMCIVVRAFCRTTESMRIKYMCDFVWIK